MNSIFTKTLATLLVTLTITAASLAQSPRPRHRGKGQPVRRELKAYVAQKVLPVVRQQRQKLETQLASADKAQLATYRTQLQDLRQRSHALRQSFQAGQQTTAPALDTKPASPRAVLTEDQQQQLHQLHMESRAIMQNVRQLAQKYESNITQLTHEVQPQQQQWTTDMQAILAKSPAPSSQQEKAGRQSRLLHHGGTSQFFRPAMFLLMNPAATSTSTEPALGGTSLYPNPVVATSQLEYTVTKAGPITVELLDGRGNILRTIAQEAKQEKGTHTLPVNLHDLTAGTYYYKITTRAGSETKRFVKE